MNQLSTSTNSIPEKWIDALFAKLHSFYGTRFLDMWRGNDLQTVKAVWTQELSKLSRDEVAKGANSLVNQEYCPSLPQFIKLCRTDIDAVAAYYEALNGVIAREKGEMGEWSHPAIFWATTKIGSFDLKNQTYSNIKARWERALNEEINNGQWADIPKAQIALPAPATPATKSQDRARNSAPTSPNSLNSKLRRQSLKRSANPPPPFHTDTREAML
jgi:hypothetical protein